MDAPIQQPDTTTIDAPLQPVTVTFTRDGAPVTDTRVYFQNADSTVANTLMTDATGTASSVVGTGGSVTLVDVSVSKSPTQLTTWVGVKPGDHLLLANNAPPTVFMNIKAPTDPAMIDTASSYSVYASCMSGAPNPSTVGVVTGSGAPTDVTFFDLAFDGCATTDLLIVANDAAGEPVSYFYLPAQAVANVTLDLTLAAQTYVATAAHSYHITGAGQTALQIIDQQASTHGLIYAHYANQSPADPIDATVNLPAVTGGQRFIELDDATNLTRRQYIEWGGTLDPYMTDYSTHLLPAFTGTPTIDPATHIVSWTQSGGAVQPDFSTAYFNVNGSASSWQWNVVGPGPSATIQLPTVPTDLADFNVSATDAVNIYDLVTAKVPGGYDAGRQVFFATTGPHDLVTGTSGSVVVNSLSQVTFNARQAAWAGSRGQLPHPRVLTHRTR